MAIDIALAAAPALLGTVIGIGFGYWVYKQTIAKWYGEEKKSLTSAKILFWTGVISCIVISTGAQRIANEIFFVIFNSGAKFNEENLIAGAVGIFVLPAILFSPVFLIYYIIESKNKNENSTEEIKKTYSINKKIIVLFIAVAIFTIITIIFGNKFSSNSKTVAIKDCEICRKNECKKSTGLKKILIEETRIVNYLEKDGELTLYERPDKDEKCTILKNDGFAFTCVSKSSVEFEGISMLFTTSYDGNKNYTSTQKFTGLGNEMILSKTTCEILK